MKVAVLPIVIGTLGTVTKGLIQRLEDLEITQRVETIQSIVLLRSARILRRVLEKLAVTQTPEEKLLNEQNNNNTRMDDQRKNNIDPKRPPQRKHPKQQQTQNVPPMV